jgi:hypothetical protein
MKKILLAVKHNPETSFVVGFFLVVMTGAMLVDHFFGNV